ncbi:MAG: efflux RND transporter periplasmic adaptor subunit [Phycisphaerae bacterium]|jgi:membrane fusion protein (multidrug efflux system)|nr:efflux RND transporter periplasmic adaptor subunit [Phycisphaerae bacterium]
MNQPPHHRKFLPTALLIVLAGLGGCEEKKKKPAPKRPPVNVSVMTIVPLASKADTFDLHAKVEPNRVVHLAAEVDGRIEEILCEEGTRVTAGPDSKPIFKINTDLLAARLKQIKAQCDIDRLDYERLEKYRASRTATEAELERSREKANASKAALDEAQAMLDRTQIFPPINGVLNQRHVEKGDYVQPGKVIAEIVDADTVKIVAHVPERDIHFLKLGDRARILYTYRRQRRTRDASITYISRLAHERSLTTKIEVKIDNSDGEFFSGQIVKLRLRRRTLKNVIMVPLDSVIPIPREDGRSQYRAYVMEDGKAKQRNGLVIDLSFIEGKNVRVVSGLKADDKLIIEGHRLAGPEREVKPKEPKDKAESQSTTQPEKGI